MLATDEQGEMGIGHILIAFSLIVLVAAVGRSVLISARRSASSVGDALVTATETAPEPRAASPLPANPLAVDPIAFQTSAQSDDSVSNGADGSILELDPYQLSLLFERQLTARDVNGYADELLSKLELAHTTRTQELMDELATKLTTIEERHAAYETYAADYLKRANADQSRWLQLRERLRAASNDEEAQKVLDSITEHAEQRLYPGDLLPIAKTHRRKQINDRRRAHHEYHKALEALEKAERDARARIENARAAKLYFLGEDSARREPASPPQHGLAHGQLILASADGTSSTIGAALPQTPRMLVGTPLLTDWVEAWEGFADQADPHFSPPGPPTAEMFADIYTSEDVEFALGAALDRLQIVESQVRRNFPGHFEDETATSDTTELLEETRQRLRSLHRKRRLQLTRAPSLDEWQGSNEAEYDPTTLGLFPTDQDGTIRTELFEEEARRLFPQDLRTNRHRSYFSAIDRTVFHEDVDLIWNKAETRFTDEVTALEKRFSFLRKTIEQAYDEEADALELEPYGHWYEQWAYIVNAKNRRLDALESAYTRTKASLEAAHGQAGRELDERVSARKRTGPELKWMRMPFIDGEFEL